MNIVISIFILLTGFAAFVFVLALFKRRDYNIEREIIIDTDTPRVFSYIKLLKNQDTFNKWVMADPGMQRTFTGTDGTVGFIYGWNSKKQAGEGEQEITAITEGSSMETEVRFVRPFVNVAKANMTTEALPGGKTRVKWTNASTMKYPMNIMLGTIEKMLAKDMDHSLGLLKKILEQ